MRLTLRNSIWFQRQQFLIVSDSSVFKAKSTWCKGNASENEKKIKQFDFIVNGTMHIHRYITILLCKKFCVCMAWKQTKWDYFAVIRSKTLHFYQNFYKLEKTVNTLEGHQFSDTWKLKLPSNCRYKTRSNNAVLYVHSIQKPTGWRQEKSQSTC